MAGSAPHVEWYIAREGAQHGPLSDVEMRKFVELGYLKAEDLVWCAGFPDWRLAPEVFPELAQPRVAGAPSPQPPDASNSGVASSAAGPSGDRTGSPGGMPNAASAESVRGAAGSGQETFAVQGPSEPHGVDVSQHSPAPHGQHDPHGAGQEFSVQSSGLRPVEGQGGQASHVEQPAELRANDWQARQAHEQAERSFGRYSAAAGVDAGRDRENAYPADQGGARQGPAAASQGAYDDDYDDYGEAQSRNGLGRLAAVAAVFLILGGGGWVAWQNRAALPGMSSIGSAVVAKVTTPPKAQSYAVSPFLALGASTEEIANSMQQSAVWKLLKRDFNSWYGDRLLDVHRMRSEKQDEKLISKFMADVIVVMRRKNARSALQASPNHLRAMATAFLANLKQLASRDAQTCFSFISFGEANAFMLELTKIPAFAEPMQKQLSAIFEAIADGKKDPKIYQSARRADYDALTAELVRRGWKPDDLAIFSNPARLSRSPPEKVCGMVQDWFAAQLAIKDVEMQGRLLAESLKPLVFG